MGASFKIRVSDNYMNEFIFVLYMFVFSLLKPITTVYSYSTHILIGVAILICGVSFIRTIKNTRNLPIFILLVFGIMYLIIFDWLARDNGMQMEEAYNFIIYGAIPLFLLRGVSNFHAVIKYFCVLSIITGLLYLADPFISYRWSSDYMTFGFSAILPAFCGAVLYYNYFHEKKAILFIVLFFAEMCMFANKSSTLCGIVFLYVSYIGLNYSGRIKWKRLMIACLMTIVIVIFRDSLLDVLINLSSSLGIDSYSLRTIQILLRGDSSIVLNTRILIWEEVVNLIKSNFFFGKGIGYLESSYFYTGYAHNVLLDIMASVGFFGGAFYLFFLIRSFFQISKIHDRSKMIFTLTIFVLWFVPMQFSLSFWRVMYFWIYWGLCYYSTGRAVPVTKKVSTKN